MTDPVLPGHPIDTPATGDPTAVMGRRILAWVLDLVIYAGLAIAVFALMAEYVEIPPGLGFDACETLRLEDGDAAAGCMEIGDRAYVTSNADNAVQTLISVGYLVFFVVLQGITGGSPGKLLTGLRVVDEQGRTAGIGRSLVRTLLWVVDAAPWCLPLVGFIVGLTSTGHRRVGDLAAKTYVVRRAAVGTPPLLAADVAPGGSWAAPPPPSWQPPPPAGEPWATTTPPAGPPRMDAPPTDPAPRIPAAEDLTPEISGSPDDQPAPPPEVPTEPWADDTDDSAPDDDWAPPTTPGPEFEATVDPSPTAGPSPFVAPGSDPAPPATDAGVAPPSTPAPPPQWDQARNTYIQWDPNQQQWLQWDSVANRWKLIDT